MDRNDLGLWRGRVELALAQQQKQHQMWKDAVDLFNCKYFERIYGGFDPERVDVNFANWYLSNLVPLVYFRDPFIFVHPRSDKNSGLAEVCEDGVNVLWRRLKLKQQFQKVIQSSFMMPPGWVKTGYTAKIGQDVANVEKIKQKSIIQDIKNAIKGTFTKQDKLEPEQRGELSMHITEESVFASWVPSWNMLMAPGFHQVCDMPWLCEIQDLFMVDFKSNPLYKNRDKATPSRELSQKDSQGQAIGKVSYNQTVSGGSIKDDFSIIRLYHIWDRRSQARFTISDNDIHFEGKWPYDSDGFPYKPLIFEESLPQPNESNPYPPNALVPIMPQIIEQSQSRTMMTKHRKRSAGYILVPDDATEEQIDQMTEGEIMQIIKVPRAMIGSVVAGTVPALNADVYNVDEIIKQDLQMATNMGQMMFQAQKGTRTATQAQLGQSGLQLKASARVDKVEDFTVEVATDLILLMRQFYDKEQISKLIGKEVSNEMWPELSDDPEERRQQVREELQIRIDAGSAAPPKDETVDRKQLLDLASIVSSIAPERINKGEFVKQLLKKFKFTKELDKVVISSDDEEITAAGEENQLMLQGAPQAVSPNENHIIHIQEHQKIVGQTPLVDPHIMKHAQFLGMKEGNPSLGGQGGGSQPQQGDIRPPLQSTNPEHMRQGNTSQGDIMQKSQNLGPSTGTVPRGRAL